MNDLSNTRLALGGSPINALDMVGMMDAMRKRLLARVDLADADYASVVENKLELDVLASFSEQLRGASDFQSVSWLIRRVAQLEARVNALASVFHRLESNLDAQAPPPAAEPDRRIVLMDEDVVQDGFHYAERAQSGACFRWLGPKPAARVYLPKIRLPLEMKLVLAAVYTGIEVEAVRVALNGGAWTPVEVERVDGGAVLRCRPESGPSREGLVHFVDIDCGATFCPADGGALDVRKIGIALSRIEMASL